MWILQYSNFVLSYNLVFVEEYVVTKIDAGYGGIRQRHHAMFAFLTGLCFFLSFWFVPFVLLKWLVRSLEIGPLLSGRSYLM